MKSLLSLLGFLAIITQAAAVAAASSSSLESTILPRSSLKNLPHSESISLSNAAAAAVVKKKTVKAFGETKELGSLLSTKGGAAAAAVPVAAPGVDSKTILGVVFFVALERGIDAIFKSNGIEFPAMLAGTIVLFATMIFAHIGFGKGEGIYQMVKPGADLLAKWLPVFFVPGLATLPLAPSVGSALEVVKIFGVVVIGFLLSLASCTYSVAALRSAQGAVIFGKTSGAAGPKAAGASKPYTQDTLDKLIKASVVFVALSIPALRMDAPYAILLRTAAMFCSTVAFFVYGARLPASFTKIVHPLWVSTVGTLAVTQLVALATGSSFIDTLKTYRAASLSPTKGGAGDYLLYLLAPSVTSLAVAMYSRKALIQQNFLIVMSSMIISSFGSLFGTAGFVRLIQLGGKTNTFLRKSVLARSVTTALAIAITNMIGGNISITAVVVCLTGILGATAGRVLLDLMGIQDPITRGLGLGAAGQGLGVASMVSEKDAFPFAAISMIMTGMGATCLVSIPAVRKALLNFALGA